MKSIKEYIQNYIMNLLQRIYKDYGPVGIASLVGGFLLIYQFSSEQNIYKQLFLAIVGLILIGYSIYITYFRLTIQKNREAALISMVENTCNRLAEQLGKSLNDHQVDAIVQKIRQTHKQLIDAVSTDKTIMKPPSNIDKDQ